MRVGQYLLSRRFQVESELGRGGCGQVVLVKELATGKYYAIKRMLDAVAADPSCRERFLREAVLGLVKIPGVAQVHDLLQDADTGYLLLLMEYYPGGNLGPKVGHMRWPEAATLIAQVADSLGKIHRRGTLHRDLKPENILLDGRGHPVIADLGIAHFKDGVRLTRVDVFVGSADYCAPEQAAMNAGDFGPPTDLYALTATFFELMTGATPHHTIGVPRDPVVDFLRAIQTVSPQPPSRFCPDIPPLVEALIMKNLAKQPKDRHQSADEYARALRTAAGLGPGSAKPSHSRMRKLLLVLPLIILLPLLLLSGLLIVGARRTPVTPLPSPLPFTAASGEYPTGVRRVLFTEPSGVVPKSEGLPVPLATTLPAMPAPSPTEMPAPDIGGPLETETIVLKPAEVPEARVWGTDVLLRSAPIQDPKNIVAVLSEPQTLKILGIDDHGWCNIVVSPSEGRELSGFIWGALVAPNRPCEGLQPAVCTGDEVCLREGPGPEFPQCGYVLKGEKFLVASQEGDWCHVMLPDGGNSWILGRYLKRLPSTG